MRVVKFVILALAAILLIMVALANAQAVTLRVLPDAMAGFMGLSWTVTLPMFIVILVAVVVGLLIGYVAEFTREHKHRAAARNERRERESLEREVKQMHRTQPRTERPDSNGNDIIALVENHPTPTPAQRAS